MLRGLYQATSAMVIAKTKQELITGNVANVETPGFKKHVMSDEVFSQAMLYAQLGVDSSQLGGTLTRSSLAETTVDFSQGQLVPSDSPFHLALGGNGFFAVQTEDGIRYTRSGDFRLDSNGHLVDLHGGRVLLRNGQPLETRGASLRVDPDGACFLDDRPVGQLLLVDFAERDKLQKDQRGQFQADGLLVAPAQAKVHQRTLERSNVDAGKELVDMLLVSRIFESAQRIVSTYDQLMEKAKEIGSVR